MKIHFLTFADKKMRPTLARIAKEARTSEFFDQIHICDESCFERSYYKANQDWFAHNPRGFGYWIWKPYFVRQAFARMDDGDVLIYCDAGCEIHQSINQARSGLTNILRWSRHSRLSASIICVAVRVNIPKPTC